VIFQKKKLLPPVEEEADAHLSQEELLLLGEEGFIPQNIKILFWVRKKSWYKLVFWRYLTVVYDNPGYIYLSNQQLAMTLVLWILAVVACVLVASEFLNSASIWIQGIATQGYVGLQQSRLRSIQHNMGFLHVFYGAIVCNLPKCESKSQTYFA
jgi:hypothetical protein